MDVSGNAIRVEQFSNNRLTTECQSTVYKLYAMPA